MVIAISGNSKTEKQSPNRVKKKFTILMESFKR